MTDLPMLANVCVVRPQYALMARAYDDYRRDAAPCKGGAVNQCAVRMSVALERCGFSLAAFTPAQRVHQGRRSCQITIPHVLGAEELAQYLRKMWGVDREFRGRDSGGAAAPLAGQTGVIYFNNCFTRAGSTQRTGDHIDLWTGSAYYNQILHTRAGAEDPASSGPLFGRSDRIWFFRLH